jgi:hypothetical protein
MEPVLRVLVKVQTTVWPSPTARLWPAPGVTGVPLSVQASVVV